MTAALPSSGSALKRVGSAWWYGRIIRDNARLIVICAGIGMLLGLANMLRTRQFTASLRFRGVSAASAQQSALSALGAQLGVASLLGAADAPDIYVSVLRSRDLLRELGSQQYSTSNPRTFSGDLYAYFRIEEADSSAKNLELVDELQDRIRTTIERTTGIVTFEVNTDSPELSQEIAVNALEQLNAFDIRRRREQARAEREFVESRLAAERATLTADENELANFYASNRQLLSGVRSSPALAAEEARLQRRVQLSQQLYLSLAQNLARSELEEARNTPTISVLERPEGFVRRKPRGTGRMMVLLGLLGILTGVGIALVREYRSMLRVV